ncbi:MAG: YCF48-related protein, partial [Ignavibacteriaceae bacterium]
MNKKLLFILMLICAVAVNAQRLQTKGSCGGAVNLLPVSGTNLFAGSSTVSLKPLPKITNNSSLNLTIYKHSLPSEYSNIAFWYITEDSGNVWICGDSGKIVRASLSNLNEWQLRNSGINSNETISWLEFIDTSTIFAAGGNGTIYETIDAGLNWTVSFSDISVTSYIDKIKFFTPTIGIAVGDQPVSTSGSPMAFLETTDGGKTWTNNNTLILGYANYSVISFQPPSNAFLLGYYNYNSKSYEGIWYTSDLGKDWKFNSVGSSSLDSTVSSDAEAFKDADTGIVVKADSTLWLTVNAGLSWQYIEKFPVLAYSACFVPNTDYAFAGGVNGLLAKINIDSLTSEIQYDVDTTIYTFVNFVSLSNGYLLEGGSIGCFFSTIDTLILKRGDVDGNASGGPDAYSASLVLKYLADLDTLNTQQLATAEVDGNAQVTANDAYWILYA